MPRAAGASVELDDRALLAEADLIVGGEEARKARRQGLYAAYVLALLGGVYGFPIIQAIFRTSDSGWLRQQLTSPAALGLSLASAAAVVGLAYWQVVSGVL